MCGKWRGEEEDGKWRGKVVCGCGGWKVEGEGCVIPGRVELLEDQERDRGTE